MNETGDYRADLEKLRDMVTLPVPQTFEFGLARIPIEVSQDELAIGVPATRAVTPGEQPNTD